MPNVRRKQLVALNRSYAYVVSDQLAATVQGLRDGLVQSGFERLDTKELIRVPNDDIVVGNLFAQDITVPLPESDAAIALPDQDTLDKLPASLRKRIEVSPETGTLTIRGAITAQEVKKVAATFSAPEAEKAMRQELDSALAARIAPATRARTPAERGMEARIPQLELKQGSFFEVFRETALLDADWEIDAFDPALTEGEFAHDLEALRRAQLSISQLETVICDVYDKLDSQLNLFGVEEGWDQAELVGWLDRNIAFPYADRDQKVAWSGELARVQAHAAVHRGGAGLSKVPPARRSRAQTCSRIARSQATGIRATTAR
jgi:type III restriction enzyme